MHNKNQSSELRIYPCDTWDQFTAVVRKTRLKPKEDSSDKTSNFGAGVIFRGHSDPEWC